MQRRARQMTSFDREASVPKPAATGGALRPRLDRTPVIATPTVRVRQREYNAMLFFVAATVLASMLAAEVSLDGAALPRDSEASVGIFKYARDGMLAMAAAYTAVAYYQSFAKLMFIPLTLIGLSAVFRSEFFTLLGVFAALRLILVFSFSIIVYRALEASGIKALDGLIVIVAAYVVIATPMALLQVSWGFSRFGTTFFGSRAMGFTENPIIFSQVMASAAILVALRPKIGLWSMFVIGLCAVLALVSGGRGGLLAIIMMVSVLMFVDRNKVTAASLTYLGIGFLSAPIVFWLISDESISGRVGTATNDNFDGRIPLWTSVIERYVSIDDVTTILFGYAPGLGTNALVNLSLSNPYLMPFETAVADSTFMTAFLSFGVIGLVAILLVMIKYIVSIKYFYRVICLVSIFPLVMSQSTLELFPANIFLALIFGVMLWLSDNSPRSKASASPKE